MYTQAYANDPLTMYDTWGLRPNMEHWFYTKVVIHTTTYASLIW